MAEARNPISSSRLRIALAQAQMLAADVAGWLRAHPRRVAAGIGGALLFSSAGAWALVEVAPPLPPRTLQSVAVAIDAADQTQALAETRASYATQTLVRRQDTVQSLLRRLRVSDPEAIKALSADPHLRAVIAAGPSDQPVLARIDAQGALLQLDALLPPADSGFDSLVWTAVQVRPGEDGALQVRTAERVAQRQTRLAQADITGPLQTALTQAQVPRAVARQFESAFGEQVDLRRGLRRGDSLAVVWSVDTLDGRELRPGRLLAAELRTRGRSLQAVWFNPREGKGGFYTPDGRGLERTWASSPLPGATITSPFGMRLHPVTGRREMHEGVDYSAPIGTPVPTVADGRVAFAGWKNGYGNVIRVQHPGGFETVYAHLSRIEVRAGQSVREGEVIAKSGNTGTSTGAHLHFEFHARGRLVNPLQMAQYVPQGRALDAADRAAFFAATATARTQLARAFGDHGVQFARAD